MKFNMMSHEKNKLKEQSEEVTFSFQDAKDQIHELSCKYNCKYLFVITRFAHRKTTLLVILRVLHFIAFEFVAILDLKRLCKHRRWLKVILWPPQKLETIPFKVSVLRIRTRFLIVKICRSYLNPRLWYMPNSYSTDIFKTLSLGASPNIVSFLNENETNASFKLRLYFVYIRLDFVYISF